MSEKAKFTDLGPDEVRMDYLGKKFLLVQRKRGALGIGLAVQLYELDGLDRKHVKEIGWTKSDNHGNGDYRDSYLKRVATMTECKAAAVEYIDVLLK